jgi:hypothetical protein
MSVDCVSWLLSGVTSVRSRGSEMDVASAEVGLVGGSVVLAVAGVIWDG